MSNKETKDLATGRNQTLVIRSEKNFIANEESYDLELEPLFANHFELVQVGSDIFLDIGIVRPGDLISLKENIDKAPLEVHSIKFNILQRIVMSRDGFERLKSSVDQITTGTGGPIAGD